MTVRAKFKRIFESKTPVQRGTISKVSDSSIYVTSPAGLREFQVTTPGSYKVGDKVRFQASALIGLIPSGVEGKIVAV